MSNITDYPMGDYEVYKKLFRNFLNRIGMTEKDVQFPWVIISLIAIVESIPIKPKNRKNHWVELVACQE
jgi:hypothetical protein